MNQIVDIIKLVRLKTKVQTFRIELLLDIGKFILNNIIKIIVYFKQYQSF